MPDFPATQEIPAKKIHFSGIPEGVDKQLLASDAEKSFDRLAGILNSELALEAHFKDIRKHGGGEKVEVRVKAVTPREHFHASANAWRIENALKAALLILEKEARNAKSKKS
ncbi:MAG TPA: hypothetical protein VFF09_03605 [archaeon]|nr:hypothetical protein [archaeon]